MRELIQRKLITESTGKLTLISVAGSVIITLILTSMMSLIILKKLSVELLTANGIIGLIVPLFVAPFALELLKTATNWEKISNELQHENTERKKQEQKAGQKAREMQAISELAVECAVAATDADLMKLIAEKLRDITDALGVGVTVYDPVNRTLTVKHIAVTGQLLSLANQLAGHNLVGMVIPVSKEMENRMLTGVSETLSDFSEVTFGVVPKAIGSKIKETLGLGNFTGLAFAHRGELIGTAVIVERERQSSMDQDVYKTLAHVAAISIQRKHTEDALRESETKFRMIIENLSEGILLVDEQGLVIEGNLAQETLANLSRDELLGKSIWDIQFKLMPENQQTPVFYEGMKNAVLNILGSGGFQNFNRPMEGTIHTANGEVKHILQTSFPIKTDRGYRIGSIMRDVSAQKKTEADREKLITELKAKNTELEQFTYTVSHDLKAPLITIGGFLGLLVKDAQDGNVERMQKDIARITEATEKMQRLLNELLELSRIGRMVNPSTHVSFKNIVEEALSIVRGRLDARGAKIEIAENLPVVFGDQARLVQVLQNLLDNAAKFMGTQRNPKIEVGLQGVDTDNKPIFYVKDNGIGIAPNQIERVFGLFQKLDPGIEGTGIGLALIKRIIEVHGGRIWITSVGIGHGTTVYFTLPVS